MFAVCDSSHTRLVVPPKVFSIPTVIPYQIYLNFNGPENTTIPAFISQKNQIMGALVCGEKIAHVLKAFCVPESTIQSLKKKYMETGSTHNLPQKGHPPKLSPHGCCHMLFFAMKNDRMTWKAIGNSWSPKVSRSTALRVLREQGAKRRKMRRVPYISVVNRRIWREFGKHLRGWTNREWENIIFSDECYVYIGGSPGNFFIT